MIDIRSYPVRGVLGILLEDKTTGKNIIWATDAYASHGRGYADRDQIMPEALVLTDGVILQPRIEKALAEQQLRTRRRAEVFTPVWLCNRMNNYCDAEWFGRDAVFNTECSDNQWDVTDAKIAFPADAGARDKDWQSYVDSRRLEITCGEAPYIVSRYDAATGHLILPLFRRIGILDRKLRIVGERAADDEEWRKWALRALQSCYGYEYQGDSLLIARVNVLITYTDYYKQRFGEAPSRRELAKAANIISWNLWQMDGLKDTVPQGKAAGGWTQMHLFSLGMEPAGESGQADAPAEISSNVCAHTLVNPQADMQAGAYDDSQAQTQPDELPDTAGDDGRDGSDMPLPCRIYNWRANRSVLFKDCKETQGNMGKKLFDFVIGNPPYQKESSDSVSKSNGQKPMTNIFQYFQNAADKLTEDTSVLVYPGGRWIHQSGKGMQNFGKEQINDKHLSVVEFYPDASELFGDAASLSDGITIVTKNHKKKTAGFTYIYSSKNEKFTVHMDNPGDELIPLDPHDLPIERKINAGMKKHDLPFLHDAILPRSLFPIESDFVENNPSKVIKYDGTDEGIDFATEIKLFTNDKAGKAGRATWFVANRDVITKNAEYITQWQVVVSSANAGGQKRDNQLEIIDNHSAFGRSRLALRSFNTYEEAKNFYNYVNSYFIRYTFLLTDEALASLAKEVPDLQDYTNDNSLIDFNKEIDGQLCQLFDINDDEFTYMKSRVTSLRGDA